jgi:hypothetical protein
MQENSRTYIETFAVMCSIKNTLVKNCFCLKEFMVVQHTRLSFKQRSLYEFCHRLGYSAVSFLFVVFVVAGCIVYVLAVGVSFIVVFLYCVCALCVMCYLFVVLLYYCHRAKAQLQFNIYVYIYK